MMVTLGARCMESFIPMIIFENPSRLYLHREISDNIFLVVYCTGPRGFMYSALFIERLNESRIFKVLPEGLTYVQHVPCSAHKIAADVEAALQGLESVSRFFQPV